MSILASLVLVRVLTNYLNVEQYGELALALTVGTLVSQVAFSGSMPGIMRYFAIAAEKGDIKEYMRAADSMMEYGAFAALALSLLLIFGMAIYGYSSVLAVTIMSIIFSVLGNFNSKQSMIQNAARQRKVVSLHTSLDAGLKILFAISFLIWFGGSAKVVIAAYIASVSIVLISQSFFIKRLISIHQSKKNTTSFWKQEIWKYSKPFIFFNAFTWVQASSDRWALDIFSTTQDVGFYAVLLQLGYTPIAICTGLMATLIGPILFQRSGDTSDPLRNANVHKRAWQITWLALVLTAVSSVIAFAFHDFIFNILVSSQYRAVSYLLPFMILAGGFVSAGQILGLKLMSDLNTKALIFPKIATSLLGAFLSFLGAYLAGIEGVVGGCLIFGVLQLLWMGWLSRYPMKVC